MKKRSCMRLDLMVLLANRSMQSHVDIILVVMFFRDFTTSYSSLFGQITSKSQGTIFISAFIFGFRCSLRYLSTFLPAWTFSKDLLLSMKSIRRFYNGVAFFLVKSDPRHLVANFLQTILLRVAGPLQFFFLLVG